MAAESGVYINGVLQPPEPDAEEVAEGIARGDKVAIKYVQAVVKTTTPLADLLAAKLMGAQEDGDDEEDGERKRRLAERDRLRVLALIRSREWARPVVDDSCSWMIRTRPRERRSTVVRTRRSTRAGPSRSDPDDPEPGRAGLTTFGAAA
jgi:hypothetical protein